MTLRGMGGEGFGLLAPPSDHAQLPQGRPHAQHALEMMLGLLARPDHGERAAVRPGERPRRHGAGGSRAYGSQQSGIHHGDCRAMLRLEQHDGPLVGRVAGIRIVGEQAHQLHTEACFDPAVARHERTRHHAHHVRRADIHHRSERQVGSACGDRNHRVGDDLDGVGHRQQRENISVGQNNHRVRSSSWPQPSPVTGRPSCSSSSDR